MLRIALIHDVCEIIANGIGCRIKKCIKIIFAGLPFDQAALEFDFLGKAWGVSFREV
jgi:hypothetical protein